MMEALIRTINGVNRAGTARFSVAYCFKPPSSNKSLGTNYSRNLQGEIIRVELTQPGQAPQILASNISYQPFGGIKALTWGNGVTLARTFDQDYRLQSQTVTGNNGPIQALGYSFDPNSNIAAITDSTDTDNSGSYDYDLLNRLIQEMKADYQQEFQYDAIGNRTQLTTTESGSTTVENHTYGSDSNRLTDRNGTAQSYDAVGNLINDGNKTFIFDISNRMSEVTENATAVAQYRHNALGQRILKTRPGNTNENSTGYIYNPAGQLISETAYDNSNAPSHTKHYIWLGSLPLAMIQPAANDDNQKVIYLHADHLDTPRKATSQTQDIVWQWHSDAFGTTAANDDPGGDNTITTINLRFPGQYFDQETGLHYNYFRDYAPSIGRYVQSDPIGVRGGINTYLYASANTLRFVDPSGLRACPPGAVPPGTPCWMSDENGTGSGYPREGECITGDCVAFSEQYNSQSAEAFGECVSCIANCIVWGEVEGITLRELTEMQARRAAARGVKVVGKRIVSVISGVGGALLTAQCTLNCF